MSERHDYADIHAYLDRDLARTHKSTATRAPVTPELEADLETVRRDGYIIYERLLSAGEVREINDSLAPLFGGPGRTGIEGFRTQRSYAVLAKTRACDVLLEYPKICALLSHVMHPSYLLSQLQGISVDPGEKPQPIHTDDMIYPGGRPRDPLSTATVWALDDFTEENGATLVIPESHLWGEERPTENDRRVPVTMPAGSVIFFLGSLWHGAGANRTEASRRAVSAQYCEPWLRTQESLGIGIPKDVVRELSDEIQRMLGYNIYPPFMGMYNGLHPKRLLDGETPCPDS